MSKIIQCLEFSETKQPSGEKTIDNCYAPVKYYVEYLSQGREKVKTNKKYVCGRHLKQIERYCERMNRIFGSNISKLKVEKLITCKRTKKNNLSCS